MSDIVVGVLALIIGALFCYRGYLAMRVIIPIWGAFAGFFLGASLVAAFSDGGFLGDLTGWIVGIVLAIAFGLIAYLYYEVSVVVVMVSVGFTLGTTAMVALGIEWSWVVIAVGVATAIVLALIAIAADLPTGILVVLTSLAGASVMVLGALLLLGRTETGGWSTSSIPDSIGNQWWWWIIYGVLALSGLVAQVRMVSRLRTSMRETWQQAGGRQFRRSDVA